MQLQVRDFFFFRVIDRNQRADYSVTFVETNMISYYSAL